LAPLTAVAASIGHHHSDCGKARRGNRLHYWDRYFWRLMDAAGLPAAGMWMQHLVIEGW